MSKPKKIELDSTLAIICNTTEHAKIFVVNPLKLRSGSFVVITPETTERMYGYKDIQYVEVRPVYAREYDYAKTHGWRKVLLEDLVKS